MSTGKMVKFYRKQKGLTQKELATLAQVSPQVISNTERDYSVPSVGTLKRIADILSVTTSDLTDEGAADTLSNIYKDTGLLTEIVSIAGKLDQEALYQLLSYATDLLADQNSNGQEFEISILQEFKNDSDVAVKSLVQYINTFGSSSTTKKLLLAVKGANRNTVEFLNVKRKIFEELLSLNKIVRAVDRGINTLSTISDTYKLSKHFVVEAVKHYITRYATDKIEYNNYIIDFSFFPIIYTDTPETDNSTITVIKLNRKPKKKRTI